MGKLEINTSNQPKASVLQSESLFTKADFNWFFVFLFFLVGGVGGGSTDDLSDEYTYSLGGSCMEIK